MPDSLKEFIAQSCILHATPQKPIYNSAGGKFTWLFDLRPLLLNAGHLSALAHAFWDNVEARWPFQVAAVESAGIPLLGAVLVEGERRGHAVSGLLIRKKRKKYGGEKCVEGNPSDLPVILIDDSMNSGRNLEHGRVQLAAHGLKTIAAFVVIDFQSQAGVEWRLRHGIAVSSLFAPADFDLPFAGTYAPKTSYAVAWTFAAPKPNLRFAVAKSTPVLHGDNILFGSDSGYFWCLERATGRIVWMFKTNDRTGKGVISSACLHGDHVLFGAYDGTLYCLDAATGEKVWANKCCDWIGSSPCVVGDQVFIGLEYREAPSGAMAGFDATTGKLLWETRILQQPLHGSCVYSAEHDVLVWGTNDGTLCVVSRDGTVQRQFDAKGAVKYHAALSGSRAVFGSFDGGIYVWDFIADRLIGRVQTGNLVYMRPLIVGDRAFVGSSDNGLYVVSVETGELIEAVDCGEKVHSSPVLIDGKVWFGTSGGELIALEPESLTVTDRYRFPERLTNALVSDGKRAFVYACDNRLWAVEGII